MLSLPPFHSLAGFCSLTILPHSATASLSKLTSCRQAPACWALPLFPPRRSVAAGRMGQQHAVPASPNRGGVREMRTPTNTPCGLPPQAGTQEDEDASLAAAMEASAMEFAIQASLREGARAEPAASASPATPYPPRGRPGMTPAAGVGPVSSGMGPSPGAKMLEVQYPEPDLLPHGKSGKSFV